MPYLSQRKQRELKKEAARINALPKEEQIAALSIADVFVIESRWVNVEAGTERLGHLPMIGGIRLMHDLLLEPDPDRPEVAGAVRWKLFESHEAAQAAAEAIQADLRERAKTAAAAV